MAIALATEMPLAGNINGDTLRLAPRMGTNENIDLMRFRKGHVKVGCQEDSAYGSLEKLKCCTAYCAEIQF